jgi:DNA replication factor GINS
MYKELYDAWKREIETTKLEQLLDDFYSKVAEYVTKMKEEGRMLDMRTVKAKLLKDELKNVKHMLLELVRVRHEKLIRMCAKGEKDTSSVLTTEEERVFNGISPPVEAHQAFVKNLLRGHLVEVDAGKADHKFDVVRFLKGVPAVIGSDMETYGPFDEEDVASVPVENARILVKQGLAERVEVS